MIPVNKMDRIVYKIASANENLPGYLIFILVLNSILIALWKLENNF